MARPQDIKTSTPQTVTGGQSGVVIDGSTIDPNTNLPIGTIVRGPIEFEDDVTILGTIVANTIYANIEGNITNAAYATYAFTAGTANTVSEGAQPNITTVGNLTQLSVVNDLTVGGNVSANYFIGDGSQLSNINIEVSNTANYAISVTGSDQPNITSLGILTNLSISGSITGNLVPDSNISYSLGNTNNRWNHIYVDNVYSNTQAISANSTGWIVSGNVYAEFVGNVSGHATTAGTVTDPSQPNIAEVGTLSYLNVGNVTSTGNVSANYFIGDGSQLSNVIVETANSAVTAGTVTTNAQPNITSVGNLDSLFVNGNITGYSNIIGQHFIGNGSQLTDITVDFVENANIANTVQTPAQPNITSLGTLSYLNVTGFSNVGNVTGNISTFNFYIGDGSYLTNLNGGNVSEVSNAAYATTAGTATTATSATTAGTVTTNAQPNITSVGTLANLSATGNITGDYVKGNLLVGDGSLISVITAGNISGTVANANYSTYAGTAYSVDLANVSGAGNVAALNLNNDGSTILAGNGTFIAIPTTIANANYSNFAGTAYSVDAANINGQVANALVAGTVYTNSQPNITSVGSLSGLAVVGNVVITGNLQVTGNVSYTDVNDLVVGDPLIYIGANNTGNTYDLGLVASYNDGTYQHTGLARNHNNGVWTFYDGLIEEAGPTNIDWANTTNAHIQAGNITGQYFIGNGSLLTGLVTGVQSQIANGTSNVSVDNNGNITMSIVNGANSSLTNTVTFNTNGILRVENPSSTNNSVMQLLSYRDSATAGTIQTIRGRGTASAPLSVQPNDVIFTLSGLGVTSANIADTGNGASFRTTVANSYNPTSDLLIPMDVRIITQGNTSYPAVYRTNFFYANSQFTPAGNIVLNAGVDSNLSNSVTANYFIGNGALLTGISGGSGSSIANGTSNVSIPVANGNIRFNVANVSNVMTVSNTTVTVLDLRMAPLNILLGGNTAIVGGTGTNSVVIGENAKYRGGGGGGSGVAVGFNANVNDTSGVAVGYGAKANGPSSVAYGYNSVAQSTDAVAIGSAASAPAYCIALGTRMNVTSGFIGIGTGATVAGSLSVAVGGTTSLANGTAIGASAATVGVNSVSLGTSSRSANNAIAVGYLANANANNSIVLNATGASLISSTANSFVVKPIRNTSSGNVLYYDPTTGEITYDVGGGGGGSSSISNGSSNVSIPTANGAIQFNVNGSIAGNITTSKTAIGYQAGSSNQQESAVAIGDYAGAVDQQNFAIAIGSVAGYQNQGGGAIAIGDETGYDSQGSESVAIGIFAGTGLQGTQSIAIGRSAGAVFQGNRAVALGSFAGRDYQGNDSIAIGYAAGGQYQGVNSIVVGSYGSYADINLVGDNSIVIGGNALTSDGAGNNTTVLNATGVGMVANVANAFYVKPMRQLSTGNITYYNATSGEVSYGVPVMPTFTIAGKPATGVSGQMIALSDATPGGRIAFWDTTNSRWSYVNDNSAV